MSRKTSVRGSSTELEEDKLASLQLLEAKRKLASTRRSPTPDPEKQVRRGPALNYAPLINIYTTLS